MANEVQVTWVDSSGEKQDVSSTTDTTKNWGPFPVVITGPGGAKLGAAVTGTQTSVNDLNTNVTVLAANTARVGATLFNDSTVRTLVKFGATASATSFAVAMLPQDYFEVPFGYTGIIDAIWDSDGSGAMRITEFT